MQRPWLRHYPPGVAAEIDASKYSSLVAMFEESFAAYRERPAFVCMDKAITFGRTRRSLARLRRLAAEQGPASAATASR